MSSGGAGALRVLVVDDDAPFVESLVDAFIARDVRASGCSEPWRVMGWRSRKQLTYDLILLDMRLGMTRKDEPLHATALLQHLMTYAPAAKVVVFSQSEITVDECVQCIQRGALTVIPKATSPADLTLVASVYSVIGNEDATREELIRVLWEDVRTARTGGDGKRLEMLVVNLFNSIPTCEVVGHNVQTGAGEIDVLVENLATHPFWSALGSVHLVIECKHTVQRVQTSAFTRLQEIVKTQGSVSRVGIMVSMAGVTSGFRNLQTERKDSHDIHIFALDRDALQELVETSYDRRDESLRRMLSGQ
jgi:ActR/RegA family two-component response regulator